MGTQDSCGDFCPKLPESLFLPQCRLNYAASTADSTAEPGVQPRLGLRTFSFTHLQGLASANYVTIKPRVSSKEEQTSCLWQQQTKALWSMKNLPPHSKSPHVSAHVCARQGWDLRGGTPDPSSKSLLAQSAMLPASSPVLLLPLKTHPRGCAKERESRTCHMHVM